MLTCKIYVLKNPHTNMIFYVGKTIQKCSIRLFDHLCRARTKRKQRTILSDYLLWLNAMPVLQVIDTIMVNGEFDRNAVLLEEFWIDGLKSCGIRLCNVRPDRYDENGNRIIYQHPTLRSNL